MSIIQDALKKADKKSPSRPSPFVGYAQARKDDTKKTVPVKRDGNTRARYTVYAITLSLLLSIFALGHLNLYGHRNTSVTVLPKNKIEPIRVAKSMPGAVEKEKLTEKEPVIIKPSAPIAVKEPLAKDPVVPAIPKEPVPQPDEFKLSGIMQLENGPRAIINNMRVFEGDEVDGAKVVSITDGTVVLNKQGSEIKLRLK